MTDDELFKVTIDLLKTEIMLIDSKMKSIVDRLWQIRALCGTIWTGLVAIGLGAGTGSREPIPELLLVAIFTPLWFAWIDSSYQRWYRVFRMREEAIAKFFNGGPAGPGNNWKNFRETAGSLASEFPVLDIYGALTYGADSNYAWWSSRWANIFDSTPVFTFGGLFAASIVLCFIQFTGDQQWLVVLLGLSIAACIYIVGFRKRRQLLGKRQS